MQDKDVITAKQGEPVHALTEISKGKKQVVDKNKDVPPGKKQTKNDVPPGKRTPQNDLPPAKKQPPIEFPPGKKPIPPTTPKPDADDTVIISFFVKFFLPLERHKYKFLQHYECASLCKLSADRKG